MRIDAALAHELQLRQPVDQRRAYRRALANEHERFGVLETLRKHIDVLRVIVPHRDVVTVELFEAFERAHDVLVIVED